MAKERKQKQPTDSSTEQKIIDAARKLFTQKGYSATKTRDIAAEAGINLALLNYYFRSKEKLFEIIMLETFRQFIGGIIQILNDEKTSFEEKIADVVANYTELLTRNPDMPLFILNEMRNHPEKLAGSFDVGEMVFGSVFVQQFLGGILTNQLPPVDPRHLMLNIVGLTIFPFTAKPILEAITGMDQQAFEELMQERKKLIPIWIKTMMLTDKK